ncbi:methionine aminopeptidase [Babesia ovis]|uniref:Methionine aminopeptidase n=1 Tax=Babesia ovis TaxID=5869 RepID=A0A9W5WW21_BABOV|nr:methionine aminopeptidase [Babesia ovis]
MGTISTVLPVSKAFISQYNRQSANVEHGREVWNGHGVVEGWHKRHTPVYSQKHVLQKERYIRRPGPEGFGVKKEPVKQHTTNRTKEIQQEFAKKYPNATIKQLWDVFEYTGPIKKGIVTGRLLPGKGIERPNYYKSGTPTYVDYPREEDYRGEHDQRGTIKNQQEIEGIRKACLIAREVLDAVEPYIVEGIFTDDIDRLVHKLCRIKGVYPSPLNYQGFPKSVCTSVNEVACHGIPDSTVLAAGDLINVDVTVYANGYHGDVSETYMVMPSKHGKLARRPVDIGMYEHNKMRYHAKFHDNIWDAGHYIMMELSMLQSMDAAVRRLGPSDGWEQLFQLMYTIDTEREPLFLTRRENELKSIGSRIVSGIEKLYISEEESGHYEGRVVGVPASQIPTYAGQQKKYTTIENPETLRHIFYRNDPDRHKKPYLFSHTFVEDVEMMKITYEALMKAVDICAPGVKLKEVGRVITEHVEEHGYKVLPNLVGHGIGRNFHENPIVDHGINDSEVVMEPGMVFTIEPIVTSSEDCITWPDGWTMATNDGKKTAQFEHTILITQNGHEILTKRLPSSPPLFWEQNKQLIN